MLLFSKDFLLFPLRFAIKAKTVIQNKVSPSEPNHRRNVFLSFSQLLIVHQTIIH